MSILLFKNRHCRLLLAMAMFMAIVAWISAEKPNDNSNKNEDELSSLSSTTNLVFYGPNAANAEPAPTRMGLAPKARLKINRKRCRYSEHEIDELNSRNIKRVLSSTGGGSAEDGYYGARAADEGSGEKYTPPVMAKHQPRVRDQFHTRFGGEANPSYSMEHQHNYHQSAAGLPSGGEREILFVNVGDQINLTCHIQSKEIDWHFKDRNLTTTILSFGLQLQVAQPIMYDLISAAAAEPSLMYSDYGSGGDSFFANMNDNERPASFIEPQKFVKYKLSSDRHSMHVLTLHVQGAQDEGSYQCVDSKSDVPVKKTILVYLKNGSRALTSGYNYHKFTSIIYILAFLITILNCT